MTDRWAALGRGIVEHINTDTDAFLDDDLAADHIAEYLRSAFKAGQEDMRERAALWHVAQGNRLTADAANAGFNESYRARSRIDAGNHAEHAEAIYALPLKES